MGRQAIVANYLHVMVIQRFFNARNQLVNRTMVRYVDLPDDGTLIPQPNDVRTATFFYDAVGNMRRMQEQGHD